ALARRIARSVYTIDTSDATGTGFAAWTAGGATYVLTARHVVSDDLNLGHRWVNVKRKTTTWRGHVVRDDWVNDLALIRIAKRTGRPLWQSPDLAVFPARGEPLVMMGSPYGPDGEGTVTTGVASRERYNELDVNLAAYEGSSGS